MKKARSVKKITASQTVVTKFSAKWSKNRVCHCATAGDDYPAFVSCRKFAAISGIGERNIRKFIQFTDFPWMQVNDCTLIPVEEALKWLVEKCREHHSFPFNADDEKE